MTWWRAAMVRGGMCRRVVCVGRGRSRSISTKKDDDPMIDRTANNIIRYAVDWHHLYFLGYDKLVGMAIAQVAAMKNKVYRRLVAFGTSVVMAGYAGYEVYNFFHDPDKDSFIIEKKVKFSNLQSLDNEIEELKEVVNYLGDAKHFTRLGGIYPPCVLLIGPPDTGKTTLVRAVAGECGVPFFACSGDVPPEMIKKIFATAKKFASCIIFFDDMHEMGALTQLNVELDGLQHHRKPLIVFGATNRPDLLDPSVRKYGRFDRWIVLPYPDADGREKILKDRLSALKEYGVDVMKIVRSTTHFSGADLVHLVNVAAIRAAMDGSASIEMHHLDFALDKIMLGRERKATIIRDEARKTINFHNGLFDQSSIKSQQQQPHSHAVEAGRSWFSNFSSIQPLLQWLKWSK